MRPVRSLFRKGASSKPFGDDASDTASNGVRAKQALGQNFLMHQATAERIADAAGLTPSSVVLEIGPGTGMLTTALLARAGKVIAVETDQELIPKLNETFASALQDGQLVLHLADIRSFDLTTLPKGYAVVANIPYYITGEIMRLLLTTRCSAARLCLRLGLEWRRLRRLRRAQGVCGLFAVPP